MLGRTLDSGLRRNDGKVRFHTSLEIIPIGGRRKAKAFPRWVLALWLQKRPVAYDSEIPEGAILDDLKLHVLDHFAF
ncbi:MAG: hypothetical protein H6Q42_1160, partial [Deltaproteobacteria bacterium]|nr:hypothetical protein [Deltaproteobacteria bacterium]